MNRHQTGYIFRKGRSWFGRWREDAIVQGKRVRRQHCEKLADYCDRYRRESDVEPLLAEKLKPLNEGRNDARSTLAVVDYIKGFYLPEAKQALKPSTYRAYEYIANHYLAGRLNIALRDFRCADATRLLAAVHQAFNVRRKQLRHVKAFLSTVFVHAKQQGVLDGINPVRDAGIPRTAEGSAQTVAATLDEVLTILNALEEAGRHQANTAVALTFFCGLRPGEARGAEWQDYDGKRLHVQRSVWGTITTTTKTEESNGFIPVVEALRTVLAEQRKLDGNPGTGPILRGPKDGKPLNLDNLARRVIVPTLKKAKLEKKADVEWHGWYSLRRGLGTLASAVERDPNAAKAVLRHRDLTTTMRHYDKGTAEATERAMLQIERLCNQSATATVQ